MKTLKSVLLTSLAIAWCALPTFAQKYVPTPENMASRKAFSDARFGIFIHWGLYSLFGQGEWYMTNQDIDCYEYAKAANAFYPHSFDAEQWVSAIKNSGAKYITFTSRHHEGFSMWDTKQSDYNIMNTPYGRDVVRQLADECQRQGMRLHLYYSHLDWTREDYPLGRTGLGTKRLHASKQGNWPSYYEFMNRQLRELLTEYGPIGAIWFDGWWDHDEDSIPFDWQLEDQYKLIHDLQPACLVGNNHHQTPFPGEDIQIFERDVPGENTAGLSGQSISRLPLETCQTMNGMWGYKVKDQDYKTACDIIRLLARTSGKGANLLLNIGPQPDGKLPATALKRLDEVGGWLKKYGKSIYGTQAAGLGDGETITSTKKGNTIYFHVLSCEPQSFEAELFRQPDKVYAMCETQALSWRWKDGKLLVNVTPSPDAWDTVIVVEGIYPER